MNFYAYCQRHPSDNQCPGLFVDDYGNLVRNPSEMCSTDDDVYAVLPDNGHL